MDYEPQARVFRAFCDDRRLQILELLRGGERCCGDLLEQLDMGQSALSYHMKVLVESGVVETREDGKWRYCRISEVGARHALELLRAATGLDSSPER